MLTIRVDDTDILAKHKAMERDLLLQIEAAAERSKDILVREVQQDLERKILRPRESSGELSDAISGEIVRREGNLLIGVGDIDKMNTDVPYWYLQEKGGPISVRAVPGYFVGPSGMRVPFDQARAPVGRATPFGFRPSKFSQDIFIYDSGASTVMWIHNDVKPKRYFEGGEFEARYKVLQEFATAFKKVLG